MTQTSGDLWSRLRRPLLDDATRFAWAASVFRELRLRIDGRDQPLEDLFARILYNDADRGALCVGFGETQGERNACDVIVKLERVNEVTRVEVALSGKLTKEISLGERPLAAYPGVVAAPLGALQGPFEAVAVIHL